MGRARTGKHSRAHPHVATRPGRGSRGPQHATTARPRRVRRDLEKYGFSRYSIQYTLVSCLSRSPRPRDASCGSRADCGGASTRRARGACCATGAARGHGRGGCAVQVLVIKVQSASPVGRGSCAVAARATCRARVRRARVARERRAPPARDPARRRGPRAFSQARSRWRGHSTQEVTGIALPPNRRPLVHAVRNARAPSAPLPRAQRLAPACREPLHPWIRSLHESDRCLVGCLPRSKHHL